LWVYYAIWVRPGFTRAKQGAFSLFIISYNTYFIIYKYLKIKGRKTKNALFKNNAPRINYTYIAGLIRST
jgi:hypothetical protein